MKQIYRKNCFAAIVEAVAIFNTIILVFYNTFSLSIYFIVHVKRILRPGDHRKQRKLKVDVDFLHRIEYGSHLLPCCLGKPHKKFFS